MARQAMQKYKIAVGICGPTILYSNVIKAHSPEEAVEKYMAETGNEYSEEEREMLLRHTRVHIPKPRKPKE